MKNQPVTEVEEEDCSIIEIDDEIGANLNTEMLKLAANGTDFIKSSRDNIAFSTSTDKID